MAFIDDHQIEEIGRELTIDLFPLLTPSYSLIERQIDFVVLLDLAISDLVHHLTKRGEILLHSLVDKDVAVGQKQNALLGLSLPQPPNDLECRVGFAGAGGHDQQHPLLAFGDGLDGTVDGDALVIARLLAASVGVKRLLDEFDHSVCDEPLPLLVKRPQIV